MALLNALSAPSLLDLPGLSEGVKSKLKAADWQTFIVALTVLIGGGFMLVSPTIATDVKLVAAGFIGAVVSYFFGAKATTASAAATIAAQHGIDKPVA